MFDGGVSPEETVRILPATSIHPIYADCHSELGQLLDSQSKVPITKMSDTVTFH